MKDHASIVGIEPIVGIDLGTTRSVVAHFQSGRPLTIGNRLGETETPSAVLLDDGAAVVGRDAIKAAQAMPQQVARFVKREMGKETFSRTFGETNYPPALLQSWILAHLRRAAETQLGCAVHQAVIGVPACFDEPRRRSTLDAASLAGLDVKAIVNEPTAAAIALASDRKWRGKGDLTFLMFDLGGGTFDASIVRLREDEIRVVATSGNALLGGLDWDRCVARWLDAEFSLHHNARPSESIAGDAVLLRESEEIKQALTSRKRVNIRLAWDGRILKTAITRERFDEITAHLLDRTRFMVRKLITGAGLGWNEIDRVMLVGGATRMPQIGRMLQHESGIKPDSTFVNGQTVAHGAAMLASMLVSPVPGSMRVMDVNAHSLGVLGVDKQTGSRCNHIMIPRHTSLAAAHKARYATFRDHQETVSMEIIEGGDARGKHSTRIGRCVIDNLPPGLPAGSPVEVEFRYNTNTLVEINASFPGTDHQPRVRLDRASTMTDETRLNLRKLHLLLDTDSNDDCAAD